MCECRPCGLLFGDVQGLFARVFARGHPVMGIQPRCWRACFLLSICALHRLGCGGGCEENDEREEGQTSSPGTTEARAPAADARSVGGLCGAQPSALVRPFFPLAHADSFPSIQCADCLQATSCTYAFELSRTVFELRMPAPPPTPGARRPCP